MRIVLAVMMTMAVALAPAGQGSAAAAPKPTVEQVRRQVESLRQQAEAATEQYDGARETIASLGVRLAAAQTSLVQRRKAVDGARGQLGRIASDTYKAGDLASLSLFLSDNPDRFVATNGTLVSLGARRADAVTELLNQRRLLVAATTDLQQQQQRLVQQEHDLRQTE